MRRKFCYLVFQNEIGYVWIEKIDMDLWDLLQSHRLKLSHELGRYDDLKSAQKSALRLIEQMEYMAKMTRESLTKVRTKPIRKSKKRQGVLK